MCASKPTLRFSSRLGTYVPCYCVWLVRNVRILSGKDIAPGCGKDGFGMLVACETCNLDGTLPAEPNDSCFVSDGLMGVSKRERWWRRLLPVAHVVGLWGGFYLYVLLRVRPELFYHQEPNVFLFDSHYFASFWDHPGGLVDYVSSFLSPLLVSGWLGAAIVTLLTLALCLAIRWFLAGLAGDVGRFVHLMPAVFVVMGLGQYNPVIALCIGLCVALAFANVYVRVGVRRPSARLLMFVVVSPLVYYVAAEFYVVFAALCGVSEWLARKQRWLGIICVLSAAFIPMTLGVWLFELGVVEVFQRRPLPSSLYWLSLPPSVPMAMSIRFGLLLFFPIASVALAWRPSTGEGPIRDSEKHLEGDVPVASGCPASRSVFRFNLLTQSVMLVALAVVADTIAFDPSTRCLLQIANSADDRRWDDVLAHASRLSPSDEYAGDVRIVSQVNRALFFSGKLLDRMFGYVQILDAPTLALRFNDPAVQAKTVALESSGILFDLGRINESEHMAHEALEVFGERPQTLKRLVYIHVLQGRPEAARRFLAVLECSLLHSRWARNLLRQLDADPTLSTEPVVASRREVMVVHDSDDELDVETMFEQLLERNRSNRMAFEYLMAHYLLTRQLDKMVADLSRFDDFGVSGLPQHCEEAMAIYLEGPDRQDPDLGRYTIRPETQQRYRQFVERLNQFGGNAPAAFVALHREFGHTYFFYYAFGHNGLSH